MKRQEWADNDKDTFYGNYPRSICHALKEGLKFRWQKIKDYFTKFD